MRISICDDEVKMHAYLKKLILTQYPEDEIDCYASLDEFLNAEKSLPYDLLIMDIVFEQGSGINAASIYQSKHPETRIIFITGHDDKFAQDIFVNVTPSGYLYKPLDTARFFSLLADIRIRICSHTLTVHPVGESDTKIIQNNIFYIESDKRKIHIFTSRNEIVCYEKLDDVQARLSNVFIRCHKSYIVNLNKVSALDGKHFVLYNETCIPISQVRFSEARSAYFNLLGQQLQ